MNWLSHPVFRRDLLRVQTQLDLYLQRLWVAGLGGFVGICGLGAGRLDVLHRILFFMGLMYLVLATFRHTLSAFTEERRNRTLELLQLSGLSAPELVLAKMGGVLSVIGLNGLGFLPVLAFAFVGGEFSFALFAVTVVAWTCVTFLVFCVAVLAGVECHEETSAGLFGVVLLFFLFVFPWLVIETVTPLATHRLVYFPIGLVLGVDDQLRGFSVVGMGKAAGSCLGCSIGILAIAQWRMKAICAAGDRESVVSRWFQEWERFTGGGKDKQRLRQRWLEVSPAAWLAFRDPSLRLTLWAMVGSIPVLLGVTYAFTGMRFMTPGAISLGALGYAVGFLGLYAFACGRRLGEDRREGVLEVLLTSTLQPKDLIHGLQYGVWLLFCPFVLSALGLSAGLTGWACWRVGTSWQVCLSWVGIWVFFGSVWWIFAKHASLRMMKESLWSGRPVWSIWKLLSSSVGGFILFFGLLRLPRVVAAGMGGGMTFPMGILLEWLSFFGLAATFLIWNHYQRDESNLADLLIGEVRSVAAERLPTVSELKSPAW